MKKAYCFLLFCVLIAAGSCSKSGSKTTAAYTVSGMTDLTVRQYADTTIKVLYNFTYPKGVVEPVTLSFDSLPPGITVTPSVINNIVFPSVKFTYNIQMDAAASFPITLSLYSTSVGIQKFTFNVIVAQGAPFIYSVAPLPDVSVPLYADTIVRVPVRLNYVSGINEKVAINADGLPAGVAVSPAADSVTPTFADTFTYHIAANTTGAFPVTIHTTSSQGTGTTSFNINVAAGSDCAPPLTGIYTGNTVCASYTGAGTGVSATQVYVSSTNQLLIAVPFGVIKGDLNCSNGTMNTESATPGGYNIAGGTGSFNANVIIVNYSLTGSINSTCTTTLTR